MDTKDARRRARELGIPFADVQAVYRELRQFARANVEWEWSIRRAVWEKYCGPNSAGFWRHGMRVDFPHAFEDGDQNAIPNWDLTAAEMGWDAQELFDFIKSDYTRIPSTADTWREVFAILENDHGQFAGITDTAGPDADDVPF